MSPSWGYSISGLDPDRTAIASARDLPISFKDAVEICAYLRGRMLQEAKEILEDVIAKKRVIPYKRFKKKLAHRRTSEKWVVGRYPVKASEYILKLLENVEANAEYKGLNTDRLKIIHLAAQKGSVIKKFIPRAYGRSTPYYQQLVHVEVAVEEV